MKNKLLL